MSNVISFDQFKQKKTGVPVFRVIDHNDFENSLRSGLIFIRTWDEKKALEELKAAQAWARSLEDWLLEHTLQSIEL